MIAMQPTHINSMEESYEMMRESWTDPYWYVERYELVSVSLCDIELFDLLREQIQFILSPPSQC